MGIFLSYYESPLGLLKIICSENMLLETGWNASPENVPLPEGYADGTGNPLNKETSVQLEEYFSGRRKNFDLPLHPGLREYPAAGFRLRVWNALLDIPYGETETYGHLAARIGSPGGARAVGSANSKNPIAVIIPCHRVIAAGGSLGGYSAFAREPKSKMSLDIKRRLLDLESGSF